MSIDKRAECRDYILRSVEELMKRHPSMRFGQLVSNVLVNMEALEKQHSKLYYVTDEEASELFKKWVEEER